MGAKLRYMGLPELIDERGGSLVCVDVRGPDGSRLAAGDAGGPRLWLASAMGDIQSVLCQAKVLRVGGQSGVAWERHKILGPEANSLIFGFIALA